MLWLESPQINTAFSHSCLQTGLPSLLRPTGLRISSLQKHSWRRGYKLSECTNVGLLSALMLDSWLHMWASKRHHSGWCKCCINLISLRANSHSTSSPYLSEVGVCRKTLLPAFFTLKMKPLPKDKHRASWKRLIPVVYGDDSCVLMEHFGCGSAWQFPADGGGSVSWRWTRVAEDVLNECPLKDSVCSSKKSLRQC